MVKVIVEKVAELPGHRDCIYTTLHGHQASDLYSGGGEGWVVRWNIAEHTPDKVLAQASASVYALAEVPSKNYLLVGQKQGQIHVLDLTQNAILKTIQVSETPIFTIAVNETLDLCVVGSGDGHLSVFRLTDFVLLYHIPIAEPQASLKNIRSLAFSPNQQHLAIACSDHKIRIIDTKTFTLSHLITGHSNSVFCLQYTPDGKFLLSGGRDAHLRIWEVEKEYQNYQDIVAHLFAINDLTFSPDGKYFATASADKTIKIWKTDEFRLLKVIDRLRNTSHTSSVNKLSWGETLLSCSDDRMLMSWKLTFV